MTRTLYLGSPSDAAWAESCPQGDDADAICTAGRGASSVGLVAVIHGQSDEDIRRFVEQVGSLEGGPYRLWLVINEPGRRLTDLPSFASLVEADTNHGWTGGANLGGALARAAGCEAVLFLNTDIEILSRDLVCLLAGALHSTPALGLVSPGIVLGSQRGHAWYRGAQVSTWTWITRHPGITRFYDASHGLVPVQVANGCCLMVRSRVFDEVGGFDEDLFSYFDEADLSLRAAASGWSSGLLDSPLIAHDKSGRELTEVSAYYFGRNPFLLGRKHSSPFRWPVLVTAQLLAAPVFMYRARGLRARREYLRGLFDGLLHLLGQSHTGMGHR